MQLPSITPSFSKFSALQPSEQTSKRLQRLPKAAVAAGAILGATGLALFLIPGPLETGNFDRSYCVLKQGDLTLGAANPKICSVAQELIKNGKVSEALEEMSISAISSERCEAVMRNSIQCWREMDIEPRQDPNHADYDPWYCLDIKPEKTAQNDVCAAFNGNDYECSEIFIKAENERATCLPGRAMGELRFLPTGNQCITQTADGVQGAFAGKQIRLNQHLLTSIIQSRLGERDLGNYFGHISTTTGTPIASGDDLFSGDLCPHPADAVLFGPAGSLSCAKILHALPMKADLVTFEHGQISDKPWFHAAGVGFLILGTIITGIGLAALACQAIYRARQKQPEASIASQQLNAREIKTIATPKN